MVPLVTDHGSSLFDETTNELYRSVCVETSEFPVPEGEETRGVAQTKGLAVNPNVSLSFLSSPLLFCQRVACAWLRSFFQIRSAVESPGADRS